MIPALPFYLLAVMVIVLSLRVLFSTNLVHSVLLLFGTFSGLVGLFLLLHLEFIAFIQLLVFVGAISILVLFGLMTMPHHDPKTTNPTGKFVLFAGVSSVLFFVVLSTFLIRISPYIPQTTTEHFVTIKEIGLRLLQGDLLAFELISVVLLAVLVGTVLILGEEKKHG